MKISAIIEYPKMWCEEDEKFKERIKYGLTELLAKEVFKLVEPNSEPVRDNPVAQMDMVKFSTSLYVYTQEEIKSIFEMIKAIDAETYGRLSILKDLRTKIAGV